MQKQGNKNTFTIAFFATPLLVCFLLLAVCGYFWGDYHARKVALVKLQSERKALLSTSEEQRNEIESNNTILTKYQGENSVLFAGYSSTTAELATLEIAILKMDTDLTQYSSSTETEYQRGRTLSREIVSLMASSTSK